MGRIRWVPVDLLDRLPGAGASSNTKGASVPRETLRGRALAGAVSDGLSLLSCPWEDAEAVSLPSLGFRCHRARPGRQNAANPGGDREVPPDRLAKKESQCLPFSAATSLCSVP